MSNLEQKMPTEKFYSKKERRHIIRKAADIMLWGDGHVHEVKETLLLLVASYHMLEEDNRVRFLPPERVNLDAAHIWDLLDAIPG